MGGFVALCALMVVAGAGIPLMAGANAQLGTRLASPTTALLILFTVGVIASGVVALAVGMPSWDQIRAAPTPLFFAGLLVVFYVLAITFAAPRMGLGNAIFMVLLGQLIAASLIDHFGVFATPQPIEWTRVAGLVIMAVGVFLATHRPA